MKRFLVIVDMQKDFVDGALGSKEALAIVPPAAEKIKSFPGTIIATFDTHFEDYLTTAEGAKLPVPHCIFGTDGWQLDAGARGKKLYPGQEAHVRLRGSSAYHRKLCAE